jgi:hypothetical protein
LLLGLGLRVRTIEEESYNLLEDFFPDVHRAVNAIGWLGPIDFAYSDLPREGFSPVAEFDVQQITAQDYCYPVKGIAMPRRRFAWRQPLSPNKVISAVMQHLPIRRDVHPLISP